MAMTRAHGDKSCGLTYEECGGRELATSVKQETKPKQVEGWKVLESARKCWNHQNFILPVSLRFGVLKSHM